MRSVLIIGLTTMAPLAWGQSSDLAVRPVVIPNAPVLPLHEVRIPVKVAGVLSEVNVKEFQTVREGQVLARLYDKLAQIELQVKETESKNEAPLNEALAKEKEAALQAKASKRLWENRSISEEEYRIKEASLTIAMAQVDGVKNKMAQALIDVSASKEKVAMHDVICPFDGVIIKQVRQKGESVQALDPIFQVIQTDVVKVEGAISLKDADRIRPGMEIDVYPNKRESELMVFRGHTGAVTCVKVLPDGRSCISAGQDGAIFVWDLATGQRRRVLADGSRDNELAIYALACSPKLPQRLVAGGEDRLVQVWNLNTGRLEKTIPTNTLPIVAIAVHPTNPDLCFTGHQDRKIYAWNLSTGQQIATLTGHSNFVTSLEVTPDGKGLLSAASDQTIRFFEIEALVTATSKVTAPITAARLFKGRSPGMEHIGLHPAGDAFAFNSYSVLQIRRIGDNGLLGNIENRTGNFANAVIFSPKGLVLSATDNSQLLLWQYENQGQQPRLVRTFEGHVDAVRSLDYAADGTFFVSGGEDRTVRVWRSPSQEEISREHRKGKIAGINAKAELGSETLSLSAEVDNKDGVLKPGTYATIVITPQISAVAGN